MSALLEVEALDVRHGLLQAVRQVSFDVAQGETLALVGANGAGKSTLLRAIAGAHRPAGGRVVFDGKDITKMPAHRRARAGIALVPEGRRLFPNLTVDENLRVAVNDPYKGGHIVRRIGAPSHRVHSVQVELNRALYLDEQSVTKTTGLVALGRLIEVASREIGVVAAMQAQ